MNSSVVNFMPGPVNIHPEVKEIYQDTFLSHRSKKFYDDVANFSTQLLGFTKAENVAFFVGSGSFGNEVIGMYLKQLPGKGLILINGEFGRRIGEQAKAVDLKFLTYEVSLGKTFDHDHIESVLKQDNEIKWVWFVHCETSTGVLNDLNLIQRICDKYQVKVAADCVSTIGNIDVDLSKVYIACSTSGKGLSSYAGISLVFFQHILLQHSAKGIPRYMNLQFHKDCNGVPFTISTNLFYALVKAFERVSRPSHQQTIHHFSEQLFAGVHRLGFRLLANEKDVMPGIVSIVCPEEINSYEFGVELEKAGYFVNYGGNYLRKANYFQVCLMGHHHEEEIEQFLSFMKQYVNALRKMVVT